MTRWWIAGLTLALGLACASSPADPELPPPYVPTDEELAGDTPPDGAEPADPRRRGGGGRKAPPRGGKRPGRSRPPMDESPVEGPPPDPAPAPAPSPAPDGGGGERNVGTACDAACDHVVECDIATYSECTGYCADLSRDQLETARDMSCAQLRAIINQYR